MRAYFACLGNFGGVRMVEFWLLLGVGTAFYIWGDYSEPLRECLFCMRLVSLQWVANSHDSVTPFLFN